MNRIALALAAVLALAGCAQKEQTVKTADWSKSVVYEFNTRQYTPEGTFAAAAEQLPRLKELGVDIVWVMPLYPIGEKERKGSLGSYYSIRDYCNVNPEFGTLADFDAFVAKAHKCGLKVIIDWVANHTSPDHPWVTEKPADWYVRDAEGNTIVEYDWTDIAKLNFDNADMRKAMQEAMLFWLDRGIDGFRCDVAYQVPQDFWTPTIAMLREHADKPLYFLAEGEEAWLHEAGFDATYAWKFHHLLNDIAQGKAGEKELEEYYKWNEETFPEGALRLVFTSNHDENSWSGTEFERMGDKWQEMTALCFSHPGGQPLLYTAQEIGYDHRFQFFEKDPVPAWEENSTTLFYKQLIDSFHKQPVRHIEPLCWWVGMKTPLQLMINGTEIGSYDVTISGGKGVTVTDTHKAESPNYIFVDVAIADNAAPGTYMLEFSREGESFSIPYEIGARREGSATRESFSTSDLIYLIMPDRFANADPSNDNTFDTLEDADYEAFFGRHGGDLQGIIDRLDYIADLGATAIWLNPALEDNEPESSYHGYACTDYYKIDSRFGGNDKYREFVDESHARGIKVIMDIVTNHAGDRHWWMTDLPFADWIHQWPEYTHSNCAFSAQNDPYCSKLDSKNMQEGWFDTSMVDMNLDNPYLLQYFKQWGAWWIEWADLDGFRIDTYPYNEKEPMSEWNKSILAEYPNFNIVGEVWSNNVPQVAYWQAGNPNRDGFNSNLPTVMDFCLQTAMCNSMNTPYENWDEGITKVYDSIANDVYLNDVENLMVFSSNHDQDRIADIFGEDPRKVKLVMTLVGTVRGIPQIYTGDELLQTSRDRSQGHGGLRREFPDNWSENAAAKDVHDFTRALFQWRKGSDAVQHGKTLHFLSRQNTYAYFRYTDSDAVFVFLNNNVDPFKIPWGDYAEFTESHPGAWKNVITGETVDTKNITIDEKSSIILEYCPSGSVQ